MKYSTTVKNEMKKKKSHSQLPLIFTFQIQMYVIKSGTNLNKIYLTKNKKSIFFQDRGCSRARTDSFCRLVTRLVRKTHIKLWHFYVPLLEVVKSDRGRISQTERRAGGLKIPQRENLDCTLSRKKPPLLHAKCQLLLDKWIKKQPLKLF